ncbi:16S rRNA (uracil(1498)-N(3))-methyltransferase [Parapedobacter sp. ISTM3]|uniref:Ribosomal RNA small subunit methyltransferase E n=1 Tax=Parapedobacter luteus TaxID=623280 RepID=A0A1T5AHM9_9SPHI|nr:MULTISPECIES: 16S rRNA (uracil(1498)-N(3))-methyltransferase [Parapedobacter]MBK1441801.1 16S rRNA (uracil(1498)-N(3))-methyltransferase [Parapedobacter sp. ISTM3]SKB34456.1 16S rRNA (uracil1498-N3)-methyltransferase [Parapedobacter luteus]
MQLFYTPGIQPKDRAFVLDEEESKHAVRVLRMAAGHHVNLVDGRGGLYTAVVVDAHPKRTALEVTAVNLDYAKRPYYLHIAIAPTKNIDRMAWFLEKATEVGIDEITPLICERSERKEVKTDRLNKVMVAAMKQSLKAFLPKLNEAAKFVDFVKLAATQDTHSLIAHCAEGEKHYLNKLIPPAGRYTILIGPEGDFSGSEIEAALAAGYHPITLGDTRLRTETAALMACLEVAISNR